MATRISGIDVSHYQVAVQWGQVKNAGMAFAFAKATDGITYTDPMFAANWAGIKNAGLIRGAYHFFEPADDPVAQAEHFLQVVSWSPGDLPPVLDVEKPGLSQDAMAAAIQAWLDTVAAKIGVKPMIYASPAFWNQNVNGNFGSYPLWIAQYRNVPSPTLPNGWTNWNFWQYSETGQVAGVNGNTDMDYFQGSAADLQAFLGGSAAQTTSILASSVGTQTYTVQSGDTLGAIATRFGVTITALASANGIPDPNVIQVGQVLQIPQA